MWMVRLPSKTLHEGGHFRSATKVPKETYAVQQRARSFYHFGANREHASRYRYAERFGRFEVEHEFKLRRGHHWKIGCFITFENPPDINSVLPIGVGDARPITHEAAGMGELAQVIEGRQ